MAPRFAGESRLRGVSRRDLAGASKFLCVAETSTLNKLHQTYAEILQILVNGLADYDTNVLGASAPDFSPIVPLCRCP